MEYSKVLCYAVEWAKHETEGEEGSSKVNALLLGILYASEIPVEIMAGYLNVMPDDSMLREVCDLYKMLAELPKADMLHYLISNRYMKIADQKKDEAVYEGLLAAGKESALRHGENRLTAVRILHMYINHTPFLKVVRKHIEEKCENVFKRESPKDRNADEEDWNVTNIRELEPKNQIGYLVEKVKHLREALLGRVYGQDHAVNAFADGIWNAGILEATDPESRKPKGIFLFAGPPGVGKTFLAEEAAKEMKLPFLRLDMSGYSHREAECDLAGFAKTYKDAKKGLLTEFVEKNPRCILLFDEIEKASRSVIHLFLQILDAGALTDLYEGRKISFKDTIVIFTTNAGRELYEAEDNIDAAEFNSGKILDALGTDVNPDTGEYYFPQEICSRMGTGYVLMFRHLRARELENICKKSFQKAAYQFEKAYQIKVSAERNVFTSLLFSQGGQSDARNLSVKAESFLRDEMRKLFELFTKEKIEDSLSRMRQVTFVTEIPEHKEEICRLYKDSGHTGMLLLDGEGERLKENLKDFQIHAARNGEEAIRILETKDIQFAVIRMKPLHRIFCSAEKQKTISCFDYVPLGASDLAEIKEEIRMLHRYMPELPLYVMEAGEHRSMEESSVIDKELERALFSEGVCGIISGKEERAAKQLHSIAGQIYMQIMARKLREQAKILRFDTVPIIEADDRNISIRLREFSLEQVITAKDQKHVMAEAERPKVRFHDVIGADLAKEELQFFVQYLKEPATFLAEGLTAPKGVLLYGPPGTGKTLLAKAMAGESKVTFLSAEASSFVKQYTGTGPAAVRELFEKARKYAPSVVFIDEIDTIGRQRTRGEAGRAEETTLNALLTEMDGMKTDPRRPVFVLAATNYEIEQSAEGIGVIDQALSRRFDRKIHVELPDRKARYEYLQRKLGICQAEIADENLKQMAERSVGMSPADLESVVELAKRNAHKIHGPITYEILEEAFELTMHGEKKSWGREYLERVARHEAGHALLSWINGEVPSYLTIVARGKHGGYMQNSSEDIPIRTYEDMLGMIRTSLAGKAAEIVYYGKKDGNSTGASGDLRHATDLAERIICSYGMDEEFGLAVYSSEEVHRGTLGEKVRERVNEILKQQLSETIVVVSRFKKNIDLLTEQLLIKNQLNKAEIKAILEK